MGVGLLEWVTYRTGSCLKGGTEARAGSYAVAVMFVW